MFGQIAVALARTATAGLPVRASSALGSSTLRAWLVLVMFIVIQLPRGAAETVLGIDLGSSSTRVSVVSGAGQLPEVHANAVGARALPTLVAFNSRGERLLGDRAAAAMCGTCVFHGLREALGEPYAAVEGPGFLGRRFTPYNISKEANRPTVRMFSPDGGGRYSPEELIAMLLQEAVTQFMAATGSGEKRKPDGIVLAVPSFWTQRRRQALMDAADIAGLNLMALVSDHAAAAVQLGVTHPPARGERPRRVVLYGIGASNVYAAVVRLSSYTSHVRTGGRGRPPIAASLPLVEVKKVEWEAEVGGRHLDHRLADLLARRFNAHLRQLCAAPDLEDEAPPAPTCSSGSDVRRDPRAMAKLLSAARKAKEVLSTNPEAAVHVITLLPGQDYATTVSRSEFEALVGDLLDAAVAPLARLLKSKPAVDAVELLGGSVRIPALQDRLRAQLKSSLGKELPLGRHLNTDEAVALGAGLRASNLTSAVKSGSVLPRAGLQDVAPLSVRASVVANGGEIEVVKAGAALPSKKAIAVSQQVADLEVLLTAVVPGNASQLPGSPRQQPLASFKVSGVPAALQTLKEDVAKKEKSKKKKTADKKGGKEKAAKGVSSVEVQLHFSMSRSGLMDLEKAIASAGAKGGKAQAELTVTRAGRGLPRLSATAREASREVLKELARADAKRAAAAEARNSLEAYVHSVEDALEAYPLPRECAPEGRLSAAGAEAEESCDWDEAEVDGSVGGGDSSECEGLMGVEGCETLVRTRGRLEELLAETEAWLLHADADDSVAEAPSKYRERLFRLTEATDAYVGAQPKRGAAEASDEEDGISEGEAVESTGLTTRELKARVEELEARVTELVAALESCRADSDEVE